MTRIDDTFARLRAQGRKAFVTYVMCGDPDLETSLQVIKGLPGAGVDIIELGLPFTDPMADGPTIQLAGQRALEAGMTLEKVLGAVREFRTGDTTIARSVPSSFSKIIRAPTYKSVDPPAIKIKAAAATMASWSGLAIEAMAAASNAETKNPIV